MAGGSVSSPRYAVNVTGAGQLGREIVKDVCGVSRTGQQHDGAARPSPIERFDLNGISDLDELHLMRRGIFPRGRLREPTPTGQYHQAIGNQAHCSYRFHEPHSLPMLLVTHKR